MADPLTLQKQSINRHVHHPDALISGNILTSDHPDFGGISGFLLNKNDFIAIGDKGHVFTKNTIKPLQLDVYNDDSGDAESIIRKGREYWVSFEHIHRILRYDLDMNLIGSVPLPSFFQGRFDNDGLETLVNVDNTIFALSEYYPEGKYTRAWVYDGHQWQDRFYLTDSGFKPTDGAVYEDYVYILERQYTAGFGTRARIQRFHKSDLNQSYIHPELVIRLDRIAALGDNLEALDIDDNGIAHILADDNFNDPQRTVWWVLDLNKL